MTREEYVAGLIQKFNQNPQHPDLTDLEQTVLQSVKEVDAAVRNANAQIDVVQTEIQERNQRIAGLRTIITRENGRIDGLLDALYLKANGTVTLPSPIPN
jgi:DNA repair ATPase RecN